MRREDGQGTLEYLTVVLLVAVVIAAAAALVVATGLGGRIVATFKRGPCVVAGPACQPPRAPCGRAPDRPTPGGGLDVLFVRLREGPTQVRARLPPRQGG